MSSPNQPKSKRALQSINYRSTRIYKHQLVSRSLNKYIQVSIRLYTYFVYLCVYIVYINVLLRFEALICIHSRYSIWYVRYAIVFSLVTRVGV